MVLRTPTFIEAFSRTNKMEANSMSINGQIVVYTYIQWNIIQP